MPRSLPCPPRWSWVPLVLLLAGLGFSASADSNGQHAKAESSFQSFASGWMKKLNDNLPAQPDPAVRLASSAGVSYRRYSDDFHTELRPTGDASVPFVGVIHYTEEFYKCGGGAPTGCTLIRTSPVTEIFPYEKGRWKY